MEEFCLSIQPIIFHKLSTIFAILPKRKFFVDQFVKTEIVEGESLIQLIFGQLA